ncbi:RND family efflux transporter, MFP subunit [Andreprevotia lacus DSM 23236]|jgi:RND family efflux transporter MFP subunit|uniref:RND family efflux transporter, MFP subunit n=1 Tax=Andreprevotia lacus DSM 23236 TaxID=1121001 RepID=A0A1W1XNI3_9NEIS|nr:efflux RND transporter periplasmic adaptor subunit [Andreprevotia lacus]SMC25523.1 RND family efflux transporter, MFP subunit [Andreprevotia lacus DSM 23236]
MSLPAHRALQYTFLALTLTAALSGCGNKPAPTATASAPAAAELAREDVVTIKRSDLNHSIPLTGSLQALRQTTLTAQVEGVVGSVAVRPGAAVAAGQELAMFDTRDLEKQLLVSKAQLEKSREMLDLNRKQAERNANLLKQNFISRNAFDATNSQVQTSVADVNVSEAQLALAKQALAKTRVTAPFAGTISERLVEPGQHVGLNSKLFTVVDLSELEWVAAVPSSQIGEVHVGQTATLKVDGFSGEFSGQVSRINPAVDAVNKTVEVYIRIINDQGSLRAGLFGQGRLAIDTRKDALVAPAAAVREENGQRFVLQVDKGTLVRRNVVLGAADAASNTVEIQSGLEAGAVVLVSGVRLTAGMPVKLQASQP